MAAPDFLLDVAQPGALSAWLRARGWIEEGEAVDYLESAGDGNMNLTLRAGIGGRTLIVKQSRPWVEKYPDFAAPGERVLTEAAFYGAVASDPGLSAAMPKLLFVDEPCRMIALEDLGTAADCSDVYGGGELRARDRAALLGWLGALHRASVPPSDRLANRAMRELNHQHIFELPMQPGTFDVDGFHPGLQAQARRLHSDPLYADTVRALGQRYLEDGTSLLHGDFYPGSWLRTRAGVRVIDPEFCFLGPAEFDVGVYLAHGVLAGGAPMQVRMTAAAEYDAPPTFSWALARQFAGVEIMRRLIGIAQLPLAADLGRRATMIRWSRAWVLHPETDP